MRLSDREIEKKLKGIEAVRGASGRLKDEIEQLDILEHIADCFSDVHQDVICNSHPFINLPGGRGSGKSSYISLEVINQLMKDTTHQSNALVIRKYANTLRGSVFNQIQWAIDILGVSEYWKSTIQPLEFRYITGQVIRFSGLDDPTKLKSLKPAKGFFRFLWIEEFSEITGEVELRNLQQSVLRGGDRFTVFRSFNPPISINNWANEYVDRADDRSLTVRTNYKMVPAEWLGDLFLSEAERLKEINPKAYEHEFLGIPVGNGSEVFPNLEIRTITDEEIQTQTYIYQGLDFGFAQDPFAFERVAYDSKTDTIYFIDEIVKRGCSNAETADMIKERGYQYTSNIETSIFTIGEYLEKQLIICDCAEPKSINDLQNQGLKAIGCQKFPGCVQYRIKWLQHRKIVIDPKRTPEAAREFRNYCYVVDKSSGEVTSELPDKDNHTIDSCAYALDRIIYRKGSKGISA